MKLTRNRPPAARGAYQAQHVLSLGAAILAGAFLIGCAPAVVRVKVPPENVIKANEAARDADLAFARRDYYAALIKYLEASRYNPNSEYIQNKLGIAYSQLKYYPQASAALQRAIGLNAKYPYAYNNLGTVYFAASDTRNAEKYFKKAIGLNSKVASFHINLGTLYFEKGKFDKAIAEFRTGLALDPDIMNKSEGISLAAPGSRASDPRKAYGLARIYASMGDVGKAVESLQQALNAGFTDIEAIRNEPDFDPIRKDEKFIAFMKTASLLTKP